MVGRHPWGTLILFLLFWPGRGHAVIDPAEVGALLAIKKSLNDPMDYLGSWNRGDPCVDWEGILCFDATTEDGYLHVRELHLLNKNLSGSLAPELGQLLHMEILDFMWNKISGGIPKEIGNIVSLKLLLLNGNQLSGSLPTEIGNLLNLDKIQIDQNMISGTLPASLANLEKAKHFHMNNNSISGQIPLGLSRLTNLVHLLLDNNNLTGFLPEELSSLPNLKILQLDNNNFNGASIPSSFGNMKNLLKLSLRNCRLQGPFPDLSGIPGLAYLDLSGNQLSGPIPSRKLSVNITTINLSNNHLNGSIPASLSGLPFLQFLSIENNSLIGSIPDAIWQNITLDANRSLTLDFRNNALANLSHAVHLPRNVSLLLHGNPVCAEAAQLNILQFCEVQSEWHPPGGFTKKTNSCLSQSCPLESSYEYNLAYPEMCFCAAPARVGYRLKSPGFSDFRPYVETFKVYLASGLHLKFYQLDIDSFFWEEGPRLRMYFKLFPDNTSLFKLSEITRIGSMFTRWDIPESDIFGPYELLNFTLSGPYVREKKGEPSSSQSKAQMAGIIVGSIAAAVILSVVISFIILKLKSTSQATSRKHNVSNLQIKIDGVKKFAFEELSLATNKFSNSAVVGRGGYGKVYRGVLADGSTVAIKRAEEGTLQGSKEFFTEIELLSRLHHRNLVKLIGYCDEENEQMLVYEFVPNGTLRSHLSENSEGSLSFSLRLRIALGSARGILYLHTEADPPIIHQDIKSSNILLDFKNNAKVADFGLSRLAPVPDDEGSLYGHISTVVKGTPGYVDPDYLLTYKLTNKSDVYSLGVVFLELLTGMKPISHGKNIVREVSTAYQSGVMSSVIDKRMGSYPTECAGRFMALALRCCQDEGDSRPSMAEVVRELDIIYGMVPEANTTTSVSMTTDSSNLAPSPSLAPSASFSNPYMDHFVSLPAMATNLGSSLPFSPS